MTTDAQVSEKLLQVDSDASKFVRPVPIWKEMEIAVIVEGTETEDGEPVYKKTKMPVLIGFQKKIVHLPMKFINSDLPKANLGPREMKIVLKSMDAAYHLMQREILEPDKDYTSMLIRLNGLIQGIINTSRGYLGFHTRWSKSQANYSYNMQNELQGRQAMLEEYEKAERQPTIIEKVKQKAGFGDKLDDFARRQQAGNQKFNKYGVNEGFI